MINWETSSECWQNHRALIREARDWWAETHPGQPVNRTLAARAFALSLGQPEDWLLLSSTHQVTKTQAAAEINASGMVCPKCGGRVLFEATKTLCPKANPRQYRATFYCTECLWHFFSRSDPRDILAAVKLRDLTGLDQVEGIL